MTALRRLRTKFRVTALPTFFETMNPNRVGASDGPASADTTAVPVDVRRPRLTMVR